MKESYSDARREIRNDENVSINYYGRSVHQKANMGDALSVSRLGGNGLKRRADAALLSREHPITSAYAKSGFFDKMVMKEFKS